MASCDFPPSSVLPTCLHIFEVLPPSHPSPHPSRLSSETDCEGPSSSPHLSTHTDMLAPFFLSDSSVPRSLSLVFLIFGTSLQSQCRVSLSEVRKGAQRGYKNVWVALLPCGPARIGTQACVTPETKPSFHSTQLRHSQGKYFEPKTVRTLKIIFVFNAGSLRCHDLPKVTQFLPTCFSHLSQKPSVNFSGP